MGRTHQRSRRDGRADAIREVAADPAKPSVLANDRGHGRQVVEAAQRALRDSEERYRRLFEATPVPVSVQEVICDLGGRPVDYRFVFVNPAFARFMRAEAADLEGRTIIEVAPQVNRAFVERVGRVALTGQLDHFEGYSIGLDRYHETTVFSPGPGQSVTFVVDVTDRRRAEARLAAQADRLKVLREIDQGILAAESVEDVVAAALGRIKALTGCERANVTLIDRVADESLIYEVAAASNTSIPKGTRFPLAAYRDIIETLADGRVLIMNDLPAREDRRPAVDRLIKDGLRSLASIPLMSGGELIGMLSIYSSAPALDDETVDLASEVANQVSIAITQGRMRESLHDSEARYRAFFEHSLDAILLTSPDGSIQSANPAACAMFGRTEAEIRALGRAGLIDTTDPRVPGLLEERSRTGSVFGEVTMFKADGTPFPVEMSSALFLDRQGNARTSMILRDISERARSEQRLAAQAERLNALAQASKALTSIELDYQAALALVVRLTSDAFGDLCRIRTLSADGKRLDLVAVYSQDADLTDVVLDVESAPLELATDRGPAAMVIQSGESVLAPVITPEVNRAATRPALASIVERFPPHSFLMVPLRAQDRVIGVLSLTRYRPGAPSYTEEDRRFAQELADRAAMAIANTRLLARVQDELQERRKAERAVRALNETLERRVADRTAALDAANRELEAFSYSVSHDLRAPLRHIDSFGRILVEEHAAELSDEGRRLLGRVTDNARQMGVLIDDLLAFSRVARKDVEQQVVDMDGLVRAVWAELRAEDPDRAVELTVGRLGRVRGDQSLLRQVWANLLGNSLKFTAKTPNPRITVRRTGDPPRFVVIDNGAGFDSTYAHKLFEPFQRLHAGADFEGTGIGLAIVARIVQRHGGDVTAEGAPGKGATFGFSIPATGRAS